MPIRTPAARDYDRALGVEAWRWRRASAAGLDQQGRDERRVGEE
jgi:hypothetical protein